MAASISDAELVLAARAGDPRAFSTLFERWFDRSYDVAWRIVRNPDTAAEVAQDTFLVAWEKLDSLRDAEAFGGWVLRTARNRALNRLEREGRSRAFDTDDTVAMVDRERSAVDVADEIVRQEQHDLVWAAAAALGERDASILDLHLRHDLDPGQIAEALDITPNAAHQTLFRLRKRLEGAIRSYVLWHRGEPECGDLAEVLEGGGITSFGPAAVKAISSHVAGCDICDERHSAILAPASMFAAVPILAVGLDVRRAAAAELASHGVPIDPDFVSAGHPLDSPDGGSPTAGGAQDDVDLAHLDDVPLPAQGSGRWRSMRGGGLVLALVVLAAVFGVALLGTDDAAEVEVVAAPIETETPVQRAAGSTPGLVTATTSSPNADASEPEVDDLVEETTTTAEPPPTTQPSATPDITSPPRDTTTTTATTTTTTAPAPAPTFTILSLTETDLGECRGGSGTLYELAWAASDATSVNASGPGVVPGSRSPTGRLQVCSLQGTSDTWILTADGPGGSTTTSITSLP